MPSSAGTWDQLLSVTQARLGTQGAVERKKLALDALEPNKDQPRQFFDAQALQDLSASIKAHGVLQPLLVRPHPETKGRFQIVAGERRYQAAREAGLKEVPVVVRELTDGEALELGLVENVLREDITPLEEARTLQRLLVTFGYSYARLGERLGKNKAYVDHRVRLLKMPEEVQTALEHTEDAEEGKVKRPFTPRHASVVVQVEEPALREAFIAAILDEHLSVAEATKRKNQLQTLGESLPEGEMRQKLAHAVVGGLSEKDLNFRLASLPGGQKAAAPTPKLAVAVTELASFKLIEKARKGDGKAQAAQLLRALNADRRKLKEWMEGSEAE